jgi:hypothetical protein
MVPGPQALCDPGRVLLEVDTAGVRAGRESWPVEDDELEFVGERTLRGPARVAVADAAVDESESVQAQLW